MCADLEAPGVSIGIMSDRQAPLNAGSRTLSMARRSYADLEGDTTEPYSDMGAAAELDIRPYPTDNARCDVLPRLPDEPQRHASR